jgi:hypothetical protein
MGELDLIRSVRAHADETIAPRMLGILQTTWVGASDFIRAYYGETAAPAPGVEAREAVYTFKALFNTIRAMQ